MGIIYHETTKTFHLFNDSMSYIMTILESGTPGQLYCGRRIHDKEDFSYLVELVERPMSSCYFDSDKVYTMSSIKREFPVYGKGDYRQPAVEVLQSDGSRISEFFYEGYKIIKGKPGLDWLPALYVEDDSEADTLIIILKDKLTGIKAELSYSIYSGRGPLARSVHFTNEGDEPVHLTRAMSLCLDLPDSDYEWLQFSGAWSRERKPIKRYLKNGIQSVGSMYGNSSCQENPFVVLKRPESDEFQGEAIGFSFIYSGNFQIQAEVDSYGVTRMLVGIHPDRFDWKLNPGKSFQTPEAVMVYTDRGINDMSQTFHHYYGRRLARGYWRDKERPVLLNSWEANYFDFDEEKLLTQARTAKECGVELFVLDDGWFGDRRNDKAGLGDWEPCLELLPHGLTGLAERIEELGMMFGLWIEPEMVNPDSNLYRAHPDWILAAPGRSRTHGRYQYVLDFSRKEVVDCIYGMISKILREAKISYIKWDMNRCITECFSEGWPADRQGEIFHRYILGVYDLYERLTSEFPKVLFESCASGGGRFDPGMLYYAPQCWCSDDTDAIERLKIQYGTSYCYPISSIGAHVSVVPNHQLHRVTPLHTRANVACFGTFGYELDLNSMPPKKIEEIKDQILFVKKYRKLLQFGDFYRLQSPYEKNEAAWMVVSEDKRTAIVGWYRILAKVNEAFTRVRLTGLDPNLCYHNSISGVDSYGDELMYLGLITTDESAGVRSERDDVLTCQDFDSRLYILEAK